MNGKSEYKVERMTRQSKRGKLHAEEQEAA
jgi:hypothetical protein